MPNEVLLKNGTDIVLADVTDHSPAAGNNLGTRTDQIDLTSLAAGAYRQSAKVDLGATRAKQFAVSGAFEFGTAPTAGGRIHVWVGFSNSATAGNGNPANLSGSDAAYVGYGAAATDADECVHQLLYLGSIPLSNDADVQIGHFATLIDPPQRYAVVVVKNEADQALQSDAVEMSVRLSPLVDEVQ